MNAADERDAPTAGPDSAARAGAMVRAGARATRMGALRAVIAYLRDMHDLGLPAAPAAAKGSAATRAACARRPTVVEIGRTVSENALRADSMLSVTSSPGQLRLRELIARLRSGTTSYTASVATTDSNGSGRAEEGKYKDDKAKRARFVREIIE